MLLGRTPTFKLKLSLNIVQICVIIVLFVSFHTYGVGTIELFNLSIAPWDWVILGLSFIYIILVLYKTFYIRKSLVITIIFALLFAFSLCLSAFFSPQPERALTMILLQIRNVMLLLVIGTLFSRADTIESINKKIFWTGGIIASLAVLMYLSALSHYSEILPDPSRWKPGVNYILDQGGVLRFKGSQLLLAMDGAFLFGRSKPSILPAQAGDDDRAWPFACLNFLTRLHPSPFHLFGDFNYLYFINKKTFSLCQAPLQCNYHIYGNSRLFSICNGL